MVPIIACINQKGGVGKSTATINIASCLANMGYKTCVIDLDASANASAVLADEVLMHIDSLLNDKMSFYDVLIPAINKSGNIIQNLYILPSWIKLASVADLLNFRIHREKILFNKIKKHVADFQFVIIDCPPTLGTLALNGIYAANKFIVPIDFGRFALDGFEDLLQTIKEVKELEINNSKSIKILRNLYELNRTKTNNNVESSLLFHAENGNLLKNKIRKCEALNQAHMNSCSIFEQARDSNGAIDFTNLTLEIIDWCKE